MAILAAVAGRQHTPADEARYAPGVCNIGPAEIVRRRRAGHLGLLVTLVTLVVLVAAHVPAVVRLIVFLPAAGAAIGYLQAWSRFCAGFGARGVFNFGPVGRTDIVRDAAARARDRAMALRIALGSALIGAIVALLAVIVPS